MNFIVKLLFSKHKSNISDFILMMMNQYIKMVQYLLININIKFYKLDNLLIKKVFFCDSGVSINIVLNKDSVFISNY